MAEAAAMVQAPDLGGLEHHVRISSCVNRITRSSARGSRSPIQASTPRKGCASVSRA